MRRNVYRRFGYAKKAHSKKMSIFIRVVSILIILGLLVIYAQRRLVPYLVEISEFRAKSIITMTVYNAVKDSFKDEILYEDLIYIDRNKNGVVTSIRTNISRMNSLCAQISTKIQKKLMDLDKESVVIPFGIFLGDTIFTGIGPDLHIKITPYGNVETEFKSEVNQIAEDQTIHKLFLEVRTSVSVLIPLMHQKTEIVTNIPIAESVIRGKIDEETFKELVKKSEV